jgi:putative membrane protein
MRPLLHVVITITVGFVLSGCSLAQRMMPGSTMSNQEILGVLNTINRSEIDAAQLAKQKGSTQEVRSFASRMLNEHQMMMQNMNQLARRMNMQPQKPALATTLEQTHQETMEELRNKSGSDFDKAYIEYQVKMHEQSVDLVKDAAHSVDHPNLKLQLRQTVPDLQNHLASAQSVERQTQ